MTFALFLGCLCIAFAPLGAVFGVCIVRDALLVILSIGSSFFWLLGVLLASVVWFIFVPLRSYPAAAVPVAVACQEVLRWCFWRLYCKGKQGISVRRGEPWYTATDQLRASLGAGAGSGAAYALIMYGGILWEAKGPGTLRSTACEGVPLFFVSALLCLAMTLFHLAWAIMSWRAYHEKDWKDVIIVAATHLLVSLLSLSNTAHGKGMCVLSLLPTYALLLVTLVLAFRALFKTGAVREVRG